MRKPGWRNYCTNARVKICIQYRDLSSRLFSRFSACRTLSFCVSLAAPLLICSVASARLSGDASLTYAKYDGSAEDQAVSGRRNSMSSNSFVQDYSLLYSSNGPIYNSRVGRYDVALGYNWTALDTTFSSSTQKDDSYNKTRGHLLFRGEVNLDPKEVPFRLNAYSRDMTRNSISNSNGIGIENFGSIFGYRDQATNINDGIHIESGATLVAGVKNGMTNGYNEILRHFPMILIDYKDTINKDLRSMNPVNDRLSRLAFVSLNKKDNWFHYRHTLYEDYRGKTIDPNTGAVVYDPSLNNYVENEIQLGTVDQYMARRWIDFSNWIKVSTDIQFSKRKSNYQTNSIDDINLNLFVTGERKYWNARTFTAFNRYKDENNKLSYQATIPLYAAGVVSQDVSWNARTSYRNNHDIDALGVSSNFANTLFGYRVDAYKRSPFTLSQSFDVEAAQTNLSDLITLSGSLETTSTDRYSRKVTLGAFYGIKNSLTSSSIASKSDFIEHRFDLRGGYTPTNTLRFEVRQNTTFTKGNVASFDGTTRNSQIQLGQFINPRSLLSNDIGSESFHSISTLSASWNPKPRLNIDFTLSEDVFKSAVLGVTPVTEVMTGISFANDAWSASDVLKYTHGSREIQDDNANSISNSTSVRYVHSRNLDAAASASYSASSSKGDTFYDTKLEQRLNYNYFTRTGISRKLLEFNETLMYANGTGDSSRTFNKALILGVRYYPISQLTLATGIGYSYTSSINDYTVVWNASAAANFKLLQASLDFVHGIRRADGARESKFTGNIRRSF